MTFAIAFATRDLALTAADTRLRWRDYDPAADSLVPVSTRIIETETKLCPLPGGWLTGGPHRNWKDRLYERVRDIPASDIDAIRGAAKAVGIKGIAALERENWLTMVDDVRQRLMYLVVGPSENGFICTALNWTGEDRWPGGVARGTVCALGPEEWAPSELNRELLNYQGTLRNTDTLMELLRVIRSTATLFQKISSRSNIAGSVNGQLTIGMVRPVDGRIEQLTLGPVSNEAVLEAKDTTLEALLTRL